MATESDIGSVRSVWTAEDEARLAELTERKKRVMSEMRSGVYELARQIDSSTTDGMTNDMIAFADRIVAALQPFCKE